MPELTHADPHGARYIRPLPSIFILSRPPSLSNCRFPVHQRGAMQMLKVEVKQVRANMTMNDIGRIGKRWSITVRLR
jgi:hypothetical protein